MISNISMTQDLLGNYAAEQWIEKTNNQVKGDTFLGTKPATENDSATFGEMLANSIQKVNQMQQDANLSMQELSAGKNKNIHETLLKVEQADLALKTLTQVKMKIIDAYREVMKMQI